MEKLQNSALWIVSTDLLFMSLSAINSHSVESKNITDFPVLMTWAEASEYDIIPRYQISEPYKYADLFHQG